MATSSITETLVITDPKQAEAFARLMKRREELHG